MWGILPTVMHSSCWRRLLRFWMIYSLHIDVYIGTDCTRCSFGLSAFTHQCLIGCATFGCIDVWYYQFLLVRIIDSNIEMDVVECMAHSLCFGWVGVKDALWWVLSFWFVCNWFTTFTAICDVFWLQSWWFCVISVVQRTLVCFDCPVSIFLNILVSKRHLKVIKIKCIKHSIDKNQRGKGKWWIRFKRCEE